MSKQGTNAGTGKESGFLRFSKGIEAAGNKLPHPMYIFLFLLVAVYAISLICSMAGVSVTYSSAGADGKIVEKTTAVVNLFSKAQIQKLLTTLVSSYGTMVLLSMMIISMCLGVTEESGFFTAALRKALLGAPPAVATFALSVVGVCANQCGDVGMILTPTIGAVLYQALGRNPWIGIVTGYAAAAAGFTANLFPGNTDVLLSTISNGVASKLGFEVNALSNYYFLCLGTFFIAGACTFVSEKMIVPLFGDTKREGNAKALEEFKLTDAENKGLRRSGIGFLVLLAVILAGAVPQKGFFRNDAGKLLPASPLIASIVVIMGALFLTLGICYGFGAGTIKTKKEIPLLMTKGVSKMSGLMLILLVANLFSVQFSASGLSTVISVGGERLLRSINLVGFPMLVVFILIITVVNLFMYSGSAKWMILAPIFIPMFANLGISPALTQLAYRIGDSCTNNLTPLNACLLTSVALMEKYRVEGLNQREPGVGTILSAQLPFSIAFLVVFIAQLAVFHFFKIPIGVNG